MAILLRFTRNLAHSLDPHSVRSSTRKARLRASPHLGSILLTRYKRQRPQYIRIGAGRFVRARRIETYSFSTPIGWIGSQCSQSSSIGLRFFTKGVPHLSSLRTATTEKPSFRTTFLVGCAGEKNRTPIYWLEASHFTTKLRPQYFIVLLQGGDLVSGFILEASFSEISNTSSIPLNYARFKIVILCYVRQYTEFRS